MSAADPWLGAAMSVAEAARNVAITGARPLGVTNCLNFGDPTRPDAFWQLSARRSAASATRAARSGCRSPAATSRSTTSRPAAGSRPTPQIGVVGLLDDVAPALGPAFRDGGRRDPPRRRGRPGPRGQRVRADRRRRARGRPAGPRPRRRAAAPGVRPSRRRRAACSPRRRTSPAAGSRSPSPRPRCGPASARTSACPVASSPAVDLFGESPSRLVVSAPPRHAPAVELLARQHGLPVEAIGTRRRRSRSSSSSPAPARPAPPRSAARGVADAIDVAARATSSAPGSTGCRGPSAGTTQRCAAAEGR